MALNLDIVGKPIQTAAVSYGPDQVILYALGIGAGPTELDFIYEEGLKVYPTFAVVPFLPAFFSSFLQKANINLAGVLHGEQKIILHRPIPPAACLSSTIVCDGIYDKGDKGALIHTRMTSHTTDGKLLFENQATLFDRTAGNFGGERGPGIEKHHPPAGREPDFSIAYQTAANQAALYRLSGDKNPLHIDPGFARALGFKQPILHGLCTFGFAGRAVLKAACDNEPGRLNSLSGRFLRPVIPGDTLITEGWQVADGAYVLRTKNQDGALVLGHGVAETKAA